MRETLIDSPPRSLAAERVSRDMRSLARTCGVAAAALVLSACGSSAAGTGTPTTSSGPASSVVATGPIQVTHAQGNTEVAANPDRVIVLDLATLDTLDALDIPVTGVAKGNLPEYLSAYDAPTYVNAGTLFEPDLAAIEAAQPDLIIVANRSSTAYPDLAEIAPTVDLTLDWTDYLGSFTENTETIGEIFGKQAEVEVALAGINDKIAQTKAATAGAGSALITVTSGGEVTAFGPGSRFGWIHDVLGVTPAVADVEAATHGDPVSFEFLLQTNPDWLLVVDRDAATGEGTQSAQQILDNEVVRQTTAWSKNQVVYLDPAAWYIVMSGLTATNTAIDQIKDGLA